jgi:hypothetical protein
MRMTKALTPILVCAVLLCACDYIVLPEDLEGPASGESRGWSAVVTGVGASAAGDLRIDLTLRNETGDWSAMQATPGKPAVLRAAGGQSVPCNTVYVGSGGHRLAPGFQVRGYTAGTKAEPTIQPIYVECQGAEAAPGSTLLIDHSYVTGRYNYYYPDANKVNATLTVNLDEVTADLEYPIAETARESIYEADSEFIAINDVVLLLTAVERTDTGLQFAWQTSNPGEYPSYVHIGNPPVLGADGIIYGVYETPDIVSVPISPAGEKASWTTQVAVPQEVQGLYILLSVESGKQRLFANYAVDITDR